MKLTSITLQILFATALFAAAVPAVLAQNDLAGTSWRLVEFRGGQDSVISPSNGVQYTVSFRSDGKLSALINCNRGTGSWSSPGPGRITFGGLATTLMMCPKDGGVDRIGRDWQMLETYSIKDGHLFLSMKGDAGSYNFERVNDQMSKVTGSVSYRERIALAATAVVEVKLEDVSRADAPATVIAEQRIETKGKQVPIPFELTYDPAKLDQRGRYNVRARVLIDGRLIYTSTRSYSVTLGSKPVNVNVMVERVR